MKRRISLKPNQQTSEDINKYGYFLSIKTKEASLTILQTPYKKQDIFKLFYK